MTTRTPAILTPEFPDLVALDAKAQALRAKHDVTGTLLCWERALFLRQNYLGHESREVWDQARAMCEYCTNEAAEALRKNDLALAQRLLRKAEALSTDNDSLRIDILNHMACYYRRLPVPKLRAAYELLQQAIKIDRSLKPQNRAKAAEVRLNACAILSLLNRHEKALHLAQEALILLQEEAAQAQDTEVPKEIMTTQAVAHHNIAVEEEFLHKTAQSLHSYRKAATLAAAHCGSDHPLTIALQRSLDAAEGALAAKKQHKLMQSGRDDKLKNVYGAKRVKPLPDKLPSSTKKAYNVGNRKDSAKELAEEMEPKRVDLSQFDDAALADTFELTDSPASGLDVPPMQQQTCESSEPVAVEPVNQVVTLLTPREGEREMVQESEGANGNEELDKAEAKSSESPKDDEVSLPAETKQDGEDGKEPPQNNDEEGLVVSEEKEVPDKADIEVKSANGEEKNSPQESEAEERKTGDEDVDSDEESKHIENTDSSEQVGNESDDDNGKEAD